MSARNRHQAARAEPKSGPHEIDTIRESISELLVAAAAFVALGRVEDVARGLLRGGAVDAMADAVGMSMDLVLFAASGSGRTAFDRLAQQRRGLGGADAAALEVLRRSAFRLLRIEAGADASAAASLRDLATGEVLQVIDEGIGAGLAGITLAARLGPLGDGRHIFVSGVTPLDEAGVSVAMGFVRPGARTPLPPRCVEAVYRHVLRHGTIEIPGLTLPAGGGEAPDGISELDQVAQRWAAPGAPRDPADVQLVRTQSDLRAMLDMIASAANTRTHGLGALSASYTEIVRVQLDAVQRRQFVGSGLLTLDIVRARVEAEIAAGALPASAREVLAEARRGLGTASANSGGQDDAELDRLIARIQALRAKTVEQGCTEAEALAAAEKVAELLDRYGLSLSELNLRQQACEGAPVETSRKRAGPVDECVPAIAAFFDCRVWGEKGGNGTLRHVFFGLRADVAAARYLYDLVELAFATETAAFRAGPTYATMPSGLRRTATNSFGIGFARGIAAKLRQVRTAREEALRGATGRDLVVAKADVVNAELARLGLQFRVRKRPTGRRVLQDAFTQGHEAGLGFEYVPGLGDDS